MLSYPVGTKYNCNYKPGQTCNNEPWSRSTSASVNKLPKALTKLAVLQTWLIGGGGCVQGTCLLEAVFRDDAAKRAELCGRGISPHCVLRPPQVNRPSAWLVRRNTSTFIRRQLPPAERPALASKGCTPAFPLPCPHSSHRGLTALCVCCLLVFPRQPMRPAPGCSACLWRGPG